MRRRRRSSRIAIVTTITAPPPHRPPRLLVGADITMFSPYDTAIAARPSAPTAMPRYAKA
jgi:hypothetical protein